MDKIGFIIQRCLEKKNLGESAKAALILHSANEFLRKKLNCCKDEVCAFRWKEGVLYIGTVASVWSQEVFQSRGALMRFLCREHGPKVVIKILIKGLTTTTEVG